MTRPGAVVALAVALAGAAGCATRTGDADPLLARIDADRIVAIADGDHLASTYGDQRLAPPAGEPDDLLAVWTRGGGPAQAPAPNSVTSPPEVLVLAPDGATAYVVERIGQRRPGIGTVPQLPRGGRLTAIDLRDPARPVVAATLDLGEGADALDISPDGRRLAVVTSSATSGRIRLVDVAGPVLGPVRAFELAALGIAGDGAVASAVAWHPHGHALALNLDTRDEIALLRVGGTGDTPVLRPWGAPVRVGRDPFTGRFTPDGRHYLSLDWGRDIAATTLEGRLPTRPSRISVIRLDAEGAHAVVGGAQTDRSSEGIAIAPHGRLVATVNMRETALPATSPRHVADATLSLLAFDPENGMLRRLGETAFEGVLPEGAAFDRSGRHVLVATYAYRDAPGGGLEVFAIDGDGAAVRVRHLGRIPAPRGTHHVVIGR